MSKEKCQKEYPDFCKEVDKLNAADIRTRIVGLQQALEESEAHKADNKPLADAKAEVKVLNEPYRDAKKAVKLKTAYLVDLLKERE